jgi:hypothetical protein
MKTVPFIFYHQRITAMKTTIVILFLLLGSTSTYGQDYGDDSSYTPEDNQIDEYDQEQQRLENEDRAREVQMLQELEPPVENLDNSGN